MQPSSGVRTASTILLTDLVFEFCFRRNGLDGDDFAAQRQAHRDKNLLPEIDSLLRVSRTNHPEDKEL
jgi:hypothetical protein